MIKSSRINAVFQSKWIQSLVVLVLIFQFSYIIMTRDGTFHNLTVEDLSTLKGEDPKVVATIKDSYLVPPSQLPYNFSKDETYRSTKESYSWPFVHTILVQLFEHEPPGFFVEAGALDGEFLSNTLWLEKSRGWSGLLIEPEPNNYRDMVYKRRKSWISNSCLSVLNHPKRMDLVATRKKDGQLLDPMAIRGGNHIVGAHDNDTNYIRFEESIIISEFKCQCFPFHSYLMALNVKTVDFLSLDLQGPEVPIFLSIPFDQIYVRSVVMEHEGYPSFDFEFVGQMNEKGFSLVAAGGAPDYFFVNRRDKKLVDKIDNWALQNEVDKYFANRTKVHN